MKRKFYGFIIGFVLVIIFLEISMRFASWTFNQSQAYSNNPTQPNTQNKNEITIVAIGESTTALSGNENNTLLSHETSYPTLLEKYLNQKQLPFHFKVINHGMMMGESFSVVEEFQRNIINKKPNIVIAMMGIKDVFDPESNFYTSTALNASEQTNWLSTHSSLYRFILNINQQISQKSTTFKKANSVSNFSEISKTFIANNTRFMAIDVGVCSEVNPQYSPEEVRELSEKIYLGIYFYRTWQDEKANAIFNKIMNENHFGYFAYANLLIERGKTKLAEEIYTKFNEKFPNSPYGYRELLKLYAADGKTNEFIQIKNTVRKLSLDKSLAVSLGLSQSYKTDSKWDLIIQTLTPHCSKGIDYKFKSFPKDEVINFTQQFNSNDLMRECLNLLATAYINKGQYRLAEAALERFSKNSQYAFSGHYLRAKLYELTNKKENAEKILNQILLKNKRAGEYFAMADFYKKYKDDQNYDNVFKSLILNFKNTAANYRILSNLISSYGGKLIVMQYPTFKLEPMKALSGNLSNAIYISNETIFDNGPRDEFFFEPNHPYNFSHYTYKGSHVLAKHIADEIELAIKQGKI